MLAAQETEVGPHRDDIVKYVTVLCQLWKVSFEHVDDIVQEAWAEILASVDSYQPDKGTLNQWACGVARNVTLQHIRNAQQYAEHFSEYHPNVDDHASSEPSPERCMQLKQAHCTLSKALEKLSPQQTKVLIFHVVNKLSHSEIGEKLGISEAASQKCYQRALDRMAQCIAGEALCVMPLGGTSCNDISVPNDASSQWIDWGKWSHYSGQIAAAVIAFLLLLPSNRAPQPHASITGRIQTAARLAMYRFDKQYLASDKPTVYVNVLTGKPEAVSLPSVPAASTPTTVVDKPAPLPLFVPLPPRIYPPNSHDHRPRGR